MKRRRTGCSDYLFALVIAGSVALFLSGILHPDFYRPIIP